MADLQVRLRYKKVDAEDWTKVEDKALRKKIQNRLAKRKSRMQRFSYVLPDWLIKRLGTQNGKCQSRKRKDQAERMEAEEHEAEEHEAEEHEAEEHSVQKGPEDLDYLPLDISSTASVVSGTRRPSSPVITSINSEVQSFLAQYALWEHRFFRLTEYSLLRAFVRNALLLAIDPALLATDESCSPWTLSNPYPTLAPHDLSPTPIQLCTPHHPYLDIIAPPSFRNNVLLAGLDEAVEDQLCYELHSDSFAVWGSQPWNAMGM